MKEFKDAAERILELIGRKSSDYFNGGSNLNIVSRNLLNSLDNKNDKYAIHEYIIGETLKITKGTKIPYAALHELGGIREVTEGMRRFYLHKYLATKEKKWLIFRTKKTVTYPKREFLYPAIMSLKNEISEILRKAGIDYVQNWVREILGEAKAKRL